MATSAIEKLQQNIVDLEKRGVDLTGKLAAARDRKASLGTQHQEALERLGAGDEGARKQLTKLGAEILTAEQDVQAFGAAVTATSAKLHDVQNTLKRAVDSEAVAALEAEIGRWPQLDADLQKALQVVSDKANVLISAVNAVGARLIERDPARYGRFTVPLVGDIRRLLILHMQQIGSDPNAQTRPTFADNVAAEMRMLCAELRFELNGRVAQAQRNEKLYRVLVACPGLADVDARPGDIVSLPDSELTRDLASRGTIELIDEAAAAEAA